MCLFSEEPWVHLYCLDSEDQIPSRCIFVKMRQIRCNAWYYPAVSPFGFIETIQSPISVLYPCTIHAVSLIISLHYPPSWMSCHYLFVRMQILLRDSLPQLYWLISRRPIHYIHHLAADRAGTLNRNCIFCDDWSTTCGHSDCHQGWFTWLRLDWIH